ncbi:hypothetical protein MCNS_56020 [Mycobacterium conspicuum]|uniref:Uncharacterized protein n=1 Tax=Mycobacterium conspicuum TaxID=44010 RepID=A0A7I7YLK5_9MYCO|nr:hypothetical protein MCNS_56020 [Mycobacterium conspicuum]
MAGVIGDGQGVGGSADPDQAAVVQPMMVRTDQHQIVQLGGAAVFPVLDVVRMQAAGGAATGDRAGGVAVFEGAAQPAVDHPGGAPGADDVAVAFEPDLAGGIAGQFLAFGVRQQRPQMQGGGFLLHIDVHHHGGVLPVRAKGRLHIPARLD